MRVARGFDILNHASPVPQWGRPSEARNRLRAEALALVRDESLVEAAYSYALVKLDQPAQPGDIDLWASGECLPAGRLIPASGQLTALACCVCSLGPALEKRVTSLFAERRASLAVALDELGTELLFSVSRRAQDRIHADARRRGLSLYGELHAGDPGLPLSAQGPLLRLAQAENIGVELTYGHLMTPLKSTSLLLGVGFDLPETTWSRCEHCPSKTKCGIGTRSDSAAIPAGIELAH